MEFHYREAWYAMTEMDVILPYASLGKRGMSRLAVAALVFSLLPILAIIAVDLYAFSWPRTPAGTWTRTWQLLWLGILLFDAGLLGAIPGLISMVLSTAAIRRIRRRNGTVRGQTIATVAAILGGLETLVGTVLLIYLLAHSL